MELSRVLTIHADSNTGSQRLGSLVVGCVTSKLGVHVLSFEAFDDQLAANSSIGLASNRATVDFFPIFEPTYTRRWFTCEKFLDNCSVWITYCRFYENPLDTSDNCAAIITFNAKLSILVRNAYAVADSDCFTYFYTSARRARTV